MPWNDRTLIEITSLPMVESAVGISSHPKETFIHVHVQTSQLPSTFLTTFPLLLSWGGTYKANFCDRTERTTKSGKGFGFLTAIPFKLGTLPCLSKCKAVRLQRSRNTHEWCPRFGLCGGSEPSFLPVIKPNHGSFPFYSEIAPPLISR